MDLKATRTIRNADMASRCGWTQFDGFEATGWPVMTMIRGQVVMRDGAVVGSPRGEAVRFVQDAPS